MRLRPLALICLVGLALAGCKGFAGSAGAGGQTPGAQQIAAGAKVSSSGALLKVEVDRDCSKLGDAVDEYVCLKNNDQRPADLGSWVLRNVMGRSFSFPTGFSLPVGATVKVHTGPGTNSATDVYWNYTVKPAWETGDKLTLLSNENQEVFVSEAKKA